MSLHAMLSRSAHVSLKQGQLCVSGEPPRSLPIEDLDTLTLEDGGITVTEQCLCRLAENGVVVLVCNGKHQPTGILTPLAAHSRRLSRIRLQIKQPRPRIKRLWQQIIQQKIRNQGKCLSLSGGKDVISVLAETVRSGDTGNIEGVAAAKYFRALFGDNFTRHECDYLNGFLDYGYAILRAVIARTIAAYGLEPCLGLFHHSEQNAWNLADDLIEPFRPVVDLLASEYRDEEEDALLSKEHREQLTALLRADVLLGGERQPVSYAVEKVVQSLLRCFDGETETLLLPELLPLSAHRYE